MRDSPSQKGHRNGRRALTRISLGRPWCEAVELANGRKLIVRPILPGDSDALQRSFRYLTPEEIRFRFLHPVRELTDEAARSMARVDPARGFALIAIEALPPGQALIGAVARAAIDDESDNESDNNRGRRSRQAEFALIVGREIGGFGLGHHLLGRTIEWCRKKRLDRVYGHVMLDNDPMLRLAREYGFRPVTNDDDPGIVRITKELGGNQGMSRSRTSSGKQRSK